MSNRDSHKDPREKVLRLLGDEASRNPYRKYGPQRAKLVSCGKPYHAHRPDGENCPDCLSWLESLAEKRTKEEAKSRRFSQSFSAPPRITPKTSGQRHYEWAAGFVPKALPWAALSPVEKQDHEADAARIISACGQAAFDKHIPH